MTSLHKMDMLYWKKLSKDAIQPTRATSRSVGLDLYSPVDNIVPSNGQCLIKLDLQMAFPTGYYGRLASRSGLALHHYIHVGAGVIDQDFRGNIGILLINLSANDFSIKKGMRIAQLILERACIPVLMEVSSLDPTERGDMGLGSSGN